MTVLFVENPLVVNTVLAQRIGLNESIVLQQLNYWLDRDASGVIHDGKKWVYNTYEEWTKQFPFWSASQIKRIFASLKEAGLIYVEQVRRSEHIRTNYYTINYEHKTLRASKHTNGRNRPIEETKSSDRTVQNRPIDEVKSVRSMGTKSSVLTETTTEITTETTKQEVSVPPKSKRLTPTQKRDQEVLAAKPNHVDDETWEMFIEHRKEIKSPLTTRAAQMLANRLLGYPSNVAIAAIEKSVENGWKGVFPEKEQAPQAQGRVIEAHAERAQRLARELGYS